MSYANQPHVSFGSDFNTGQQQFQQQNNIGYDPLILEQKKQQLRDKLRQQKLTANIGAVFSGDPFTKTAMKNSMPLEDNLRRLQQELHKPTELLRQEKPKDQYIYEMDTFSPLKVQQQNREENVIEPDSFLKNQQISDDRQREIDELLDHLRKSENQENENSEINLMRISQLLKDKSRGGNMSNSAIAEQKNVFSGSNYPIQISQIEQPNQNKQTTIPNVMSSPIFTNQSDNVSYPINTVVKHVNHQPSPALHLNVFQTQQNQLQEESSEFPPQQELYVKPQQNQNNSQYQRVQFSQSKVNRSIQQSQNQNANVLAPQRQLIQKQNMSQNVTDSKTLTVNKQNLKSQNNQNLHNSTDLSKNNTSLDGPLNEHLDQLLQKPHPKVPFLNQLQPSQQKKILDLINNPDSQIRTFGQPGAPLTVQIDYIEDVKNDIRDQKSAFQGKILKQQLFQIKPEQIPEGKSIKPRDSATIASFLQAKDKEEHRATQALFSAIRSKDETEIKTLTWLNREITRLLRQRCKIMRLEAEKATRELRLNTAAKAASLNRDELLDQALKLPVQKFEQSRNDRTPNNEQIIQILSSRMLINQVYNQVNPNKTVQSSLSQKASQLNQTQNMLKKADIKSAGNSLLQSLLQGDLNIESSSINTNKLQHSILDEEEDLAKFVRNDYLKAPQSHISVSAYIGSLNIALVNYSRVSSAARLFLLFYDDQVRNYEIYRQICGIESLFNQDEYENAFARYRNNRSLTPKEFVEIRENQSQILPILLLVLDLIWNSCGVKRLSVPTSVLNDVKRELQQVLGPKHVKNVTLPKTFECKVVSLEKHSAMVGNLLVQSFGDFAVRFKLLQPKSQYPSYASSKFIMQELRGFNIWTAEGSDHEADVYCFLEALCRVLNAVFQELKLDMNNIQ